MSAADPGLAAYGQDDPADTPSDAVGQVLSMVEVARYWNRRDAGMTRIVQLAYRKEVEPTRAVRALRAAILGFVTDPAHLPPGIEPLVGSDRASP